MKADYKIVPWIFVLTFDDELSLDEAYDILQEEAEIHVPLCSAKRKPVLFETLRK